MAQQFGATIPLPAPETTGGKPLMEVLRSRCSTRTFNDVALPLQVLANLLWAAGGVSRADSGKRTAPSARDWREIDIYVVMKEGAYRYDAPSHCLHPVVSGDLRGQTGQQDFVATAPVNLVYVADPNRMVDVGPERQALYGATDTGFVAQNVYLFCASAGLATVVRGSVDTVALGAALKLGSQQRIILAQSVGYPGA